MQWGLLYVAGAWGLLQGLEYVGEAFGWPTAQAGRAASTPDRPAHRVVLAWYHGDRGEQRISSTRAGDPGLLLLLGGGIFLGYERRERTLEDRVTCKREVATGRIGRGQVGPRSRCCRSTTAASWSDDAYFVDGIHDDILTQLSKISALKVISRTSVEPFREHEAPIKEIAAQLGVTSILEGGVQRAGDRVRITVQLIDVGAERTRLGGKLRPRTHCRQYLRDPERSRRGDCGRTRIQR